MKSIGHTPRGAHFAALLICISPAAANSADTTADNSKTRLEEVVVRGHPLSSEGLAQPFAVLRDDELRRSQAASIGETLMRLPSVHSASFGQAVGRPVIRGLGGARVKVMEDRIDTLDVSVSSPDHAATIDAFTAESIEVFMGPSTLLYGSGALGGVVDVHTGRIPHAIPEETTARFEARGADNADRRTTAGRIDSAFGNFVFHVDGFYRDADEYDIPGFAESRRLRDLEAAGHEHDEEHGEEHGEEHEEGEEYARGTLPGSDLETYGGAFGMSYVIDAGFVGLSVSRYESEYGLPGHSHGHGHDEHAEEGHGEEHGDEHGHGEGEGNAQLDLEQTRVDLEWGQREPLAGLDSFNFRVGYNDYEHTEFEPDGGRGTTFKSEAYEARLEFVHSEWAGIDGSFGVQASQREFSALGEEAFVQPVDTDSLGVFYVGQTTLGSLGVEGGLRAEQVEQDPDTGGSESFSLFSGSLGLIQPLSEHWRLTGQLDYSSRAPVAEELYSDGAHLATQSYEIGDPDLDEEKATNVSLGLDYRTERLQLAFNVFYTEFDGFIYEAATGEERDELPVLQWQQEDAILYGADALVQWEALRFNGGSLSLRASADAVRAELDEGADKDLPRIPPLRWSVGAAFTWADLVAEVSYTRVEKQDDTAPLELETDGFNDVHVHLVYGFDVADSRMELFLNGTNLTDDEQRLHTSFIKDLAPQPGRTVEAGIRVML